LRWNVPCSRQPPGIGKTYDDRVDDEQADGAVGLVIRLFNRIERWASASEDRATLVTILLCAAIAILVLVVIGVFAWVALRQGPAPA
jgi:hypothetical protein